MTIFGFYVCPHCVMLALGSVVPLGFLRIWWKRLTGRY